jgi:hypothetical protein
MDVAWKFLYWAIALLVPPAGILIVPLVARSITSRLLAPDVFILMQITGAAILIGWFVVLVLWKRNDLRIIFGVYFAWILITALLLPLVGRRLLSLPELPGFVQTMFLFNITLRGYLIIAFCLFVAIVELVPAVKRFRMRHILKGYDDWA